MPHRPTNLVFWLQWIVANSIAELVGLGIIAAIGAGLVGFLGKPHGAGTLALAAFFIALGAFEGLVVGVAQSWTLKQRLTGLTGWVQATVIGAVMAWFLGVLPSTLMSISESGATAPPPEISQSLQLLFAALLGLIAGPLLAFFQWRRLRHYVKGKSGWWLPANAAAWALGMPVIFLGMDAGASNNGLAATITTIGASLLIAGAVVGAVHGLVLLSILGEANQNPH